MMHDSASAVASPEQERSPPKKPRIWNRCGVPCVICGKDQWWVTQNFAIQTLGEPIGFQQEEGGFLSHDFRGGWKGARMVAALLP